MKEITDNMFYRLVDLRCSEPVPLKDADLSIPFVYDRDYGVFYVDSGMHIVAMGTFFAWKYDCLNTYLLKKKHPQIKEDIKNNSFSSSDKYQYLADRFLLDFKGTAMGSSVSNFILAGKLSNLNEEEKTIFSRYDIKFIE